MSTLSVEKPKAKAKASLENGTPNTEAAENTGVINPYALAELVAGRKIQWKNLPEKHKVLEEILQTPYHELFDPMHEGPLYTGLKLNKKLQLEPVRSPLLDVEVKLHVSDLDLPIEELNLNVQQLADLAPMFERDDVGKIAVAKAELAGPQLLQITLKVPEKERLQRLSQVFSKNIINAITRDPKEKGNHSEWTPPNGTWTDKGAFFNEAAEFFDPVQGAVANCYYIAALASVAWAKPYHIRHLTRALGVNRQQFTNMIRFYKVDTFQVDKEIEVTDSVPVNASTGNFIYCRSSEAGEIWPAVYEKAFAKLVTGTSSDHPDILATGWGDCVRATSLLVGGQRYYYGTPGYSADELWNLVRANSLSYKTFNAMTCWTYSSGAASDKKIVYSDANIVASHCYSILGWAYRNNKKYIIVRNPWGNTEATIQTLNATVSLYDVSWWRPINLTTIDGTFAIEASAFKTYFAGLGVVK